MDRPTETRAICIICHQTTELSNMTAGALYADGEQAFACIEHAWNRASWLIAWARFAIAQDEQAEPGGISRQVETA